MLLLTFVLTVFTRSRRNCFLHLSLSVHHKLSLISFFSFLALQGKIPTSEIRGRPLEIFMCSVLKRQGYGEGFRWLAQYINWEERCLAVVQFIVMETTHMILCLPLIYNWQWSITILFAFSPRSIVLIFKCSWLKHTSFNIISLKVLQWSWRDQMCLIWQPIFKSKIYISCIVQ